MRICLVSRELAPFVGGGIGVYVVEMARALAVQGHDVHVLTYPYPRLEALGKQHLPAVHVHTVQPDRGPAALPGAYFAEATQYAMAVYTRFQELNDALAFDYAEFPDYRGEGFFALRAKKTLGLFSRTVLGVRLHQPLYIVREVDRDATLNVELAHIEHMERASMIEADLVLSASQAVLDRVRRDLGPAMPPDQQRRCAILRLPLDIPAPEIESPHSPPAEATPNVRTVLYFGRLQICKGVHTLVDAAQRILESGAAATFRFIGGDTMTGPFGRSMREYLDRRIDARWRSCFLFEEPRPREQLAEAIRQAHVCCFPSLWESYSYACVEALAQGAVVVASDGGSLRELIQHETSGLTFPAGQAEALAEALTRALTDIALRRRLAANAPKRARDLSAAPAIASRLIELVTPLIERERAEAGRAPLVKLASTDVSVIVPFYNLGTTLPETLESLDRQTLRGCELIIVDDGSTDPASLELLEALRRAGRRVIRKPNGGLGSARNAGFQAARGHWVLPFDADDLAHPRLLETLVGVAERDPDLAAISPMFISFEESPDKPVSGYVPLGADPDLLLFHNVGGSGGGSLMRKDAVLAVGGYDEWLTSFEDWDMWCRLTERGFRCTVVPDFLFYYRLRPGSLIRAEAIPRQHALRAYLIARHPQLMRRPDWPLRLQLAETYRTEALWREAQARLQSGSAAGSQDTGGPVGVTSGAAEIEAQRIIRQHLRYRLADRVNGALKRLGLQRAMKSTGLRLAALLGRRRIDNHESDE